MKGSDSVIRSPPARMMESDPFIRENAPVEAGAFRLRLPLSRDGDQKKCRMPTPPPVVSAPAAIVGPTIGCGEYVPFIALLSL
jgi:hypothetical protein